MKTKKQIILVIFDGWGIAGDSKGNAINLAKKPFFDSLWNKYPHTQFEASGEAVGLPAGNIGSSEIAHTIIGAGAILDTDLVRLNKLSKEGQIAESPAIQEAFNHVKENNSVLHLCGQVSPGGVHSHQDHLFALLRAAKKAGIEKVAIHVFTDGRDTAPTSGSEFVKELEDEIEKIGVGFIATLSGRYYAMDRDNNWERLEKVEQAMFQCVGKECEDITASNMMKKLYEQGETDEFIQPLVFKDKDGKKYALSKNDSVIFFNYRPDRARMLDKKIAEKSKDENFCFVTLTEHDPKMECLVAYPPLEIKTTLAEQISKAGLTQAHIAETEKYAHVTFFFNGQRDEAYPNEEDILIPSQKVATHDLAPEMRAKEIVDKVIEQLDKGTDFIAINIANADMVGHTGNLEATIKAVEVCDVELKRLVDHAEQKDAIVFITADHGNAEVMLDEKGGIVTAHSTSLVPGIITDGNVKLRDGGGLADVAPTILDLFGIEKPEEMTGESLIQQK